ncbi:hypothetical protein [Mangrovimonas sp. YM274]|uniref:hypothetical protein n=1 Tax=Mangrovimonas sp. YM274 TaxID=3070660 RepID=UPI0027DBC7C3|nr:hypothetical protein [Mangrovimonas sp. YM274]WMI69173.1 hypothetical protein RBH95_02090 [Mangrovimonas sp. YM274]
MGKLDNYTEEEWHVVASIPQLVGATMASAGYSGLVGSGKELFATVRSMMGAKETYANNALITAIIPDPEAAKEAMSEASDQRKQFINKIKEAQVNSKEGLAKLVLDDCRKAVSIVESKETEAVVNDYKTWVLNIAETVANTAKEGGFLGFGGEQFSDNEQKLFGELKQVFQ